MDSLWGNDFKLDSEKEKTKNIIKKISKEKEKLTIDVSKAVKNKKLNIDEKLKLVEQKVYQILGKQINNVKVIYDKQELHDYLIKGLNFGRIAIDTETNNSLDYITCKLMGLCLYVKGEKQIYVPINHVDKDTKERLSNQLTEKDIYDELQWLIDNKGNCKFIFHNGKFDYQVLKCTCNGIKIPIDWDTMIGAKLLDENEKNAKLKEQYINKIDPEQTKYDIENLFEHLPYEIVDPELFALYSATDAMMTDRLYEWQMKQFENDKSLNDVYNLAITLEMPVIKVFAEMELNGVTFDTEYAKKLSVKYHNLLDELDKEIHEELINIKPLIDDWRDSKEANLKTITIHGNDGKSKNEQLLEPINLSSPSQLAIILYDVLKIKPPLKDKPRGTGEEVLKELDLPLAKLLLKRREIEKLINAFIDTLPKQVNVDGKIHCQFKQYGAQTGRTSCIAKGTKISMPSGDKPIEEVKVGDVVYCYDVNTNRLTLRKVLNVFNNGKRHCIKLHWKSKYNPQLTGELICTPDHFLRTTNRGWVEAQKLKIEDELLTKQKIVSIEYLDNLYEVYDLEVEEHHNFIAGELCVHNCSNPNLQQIPSHLKTIRMLFKASEGQIFVGADYSAQEIRVLASMSKDKNMIKTFEENKDIYAMVASLIYHNNYEDNLEHYSDGSKNVEGAKRRSNTKSVVLGLNYGRGTASIAEQIGESYEDTQTIVDEYFKEFPNIKKLINDSQKNARKYGYVTDLWGRRRRLPDIQLPRYEVRSKKEDSLFNPFLICKDRQIKNSLVDKYIEKIDSAKYKRDIDKIKQEATKDGIEIKDNTGFISQAERQCLNARIQGSSASMTKQAMLNIYNDEELNKLGFKLLINIHDELVGECPKENAEECAKRLEEVMKNAAKEKCSCPFKCDADISKKWYYNENCAELQKTLDNYMNNGLSKQDAFEKLCLENSEFSKEELIEMCEL